MPGIEHQAARAIVRNGLPSVEHQCRTSHRRVDDHLFLDAAAGKGVRVLACWAAQLQTALLRLGNLVPLDLHPRLWPPQTVSTARSAPGSRRGRRTPVREGDRHG